MKLVTWNVNGIRSVFGKSFRDWRIDYLFVSPPLKHTIQDAFTRREILGSDHGPCGVILNIPFTILNRPIYSKTPSQGSLL